ncbi:hypothetical protein MKX08_000768 [Trichoderma sp. CBMAI-0020]|nr:hypothetical protein MKX08_000768 [Trichoderma sp. CBMAI-0020]
MPRSAASHSNSSGRKASQLGQPHHRDTGPQLAPNPQWGPANAMPPVQPSRIKQKPPTGRQLHAGAWIAAAASPRLRDGFREPNFQNRGTCHKQRLDAWDPRLHVASLFFVSVCFDLLFQMARHLGHGLYRPASHRTQRDGYGVHGFETTALATPTARISSGAHKVIVALIGKAMPPGRRLARRSLSTCAGVVQKPPAADPVQAALARGPNHAMISVAWAYDRGQLIGCDSEGSPAIQKVPMRRFPANTATTLAWTLDLDPGGHDEVRGTKVD